MFKAHKDNAPEIVPLNDDWAGFDLENLSVEELEQRFELSLINLPLGLGELEECKADCTCHGCNTNGCCTHS